MLKMLTCSLLTLTCICVSLQGLAQQTEELKLNQAVKTFQVDLDGDGDLELVKTQVCALDDEGHTERLVVSKTNGQVIWQGPALDIRNGYQDDQPMFGAWPFGISEVSLVADLDEDGVVELLAPAPQSDVRPTVWRLFSWNGKAFSHQISGYLREEDEGEFNWNETSGKSWVSRLEIKNNQVIAEITQDQKKDGLFVGKALMVVTADGLRIKRWLMSLTPIEE